MAAIPGNVALLQYNRQIPVKGNEKKWKQVHSGSVNLLLGLLDDDYDNFIFRTSPTNTASFALNL